MHHVGLVVCGAICLAYLCNAQVFIKVVGDDTSSKLESVGNYTEISANFSKSVNSLQKQLNSLDSEGYKQFDLHKKSLKSLTKLVTNEQKPAIATSCAEAMDGSKVNGVYKINVPGYIETPFDVYCMVDVNGGPAWTVVLRRQDGSVDFYRGWFEYQKGFGDLSGEFWMGLDKLYAITNYREQELRLDFEDFEGETAFARYESFAIGDEVSAYQMRVVGLFSGNASDSLNTHKGKKFTTHDNDNDGYEKGNCALDFFGAWWYSRCHDSNLAGLYLRGANKDGEKGHGVEWSKWHKHYSLKYAVMAIRPVV